MTYPEPILDKARTVRLLILDVDGVLTDGRLYYSESGEESKAFCTQDGAAIKMLAETGVLVAIITGRQSKIVARRAAELGVQHVYQGASDKARALEQLIVHTGIDRPQIAHVGDDLPDLPLFNRVGMTFSVPGAHPEVIDTRRLRHPGGRRTRRGARSLSPADGCPGDLGRRARPIRHMNRWPWLLVIFGGLALFCSLGDWKHSEVAPGRSTGRCRRTGPVHGEGHDHAVRRRRRRALSAGCRAEVRHYEEESLTRLASANDDAVSRPSTTLVCAFERRARSRDADPAEKQPAK